MSWVGNTRQLPIEPDEPDHHEPRRAGGGGLSWFTGVLTTAVVLLAILVAGTKLLGEFRGFAGAPAAEVTVHVLGAVAAIVLQLGVRRGGAALRMLGTLALLAILAGLLWFYWYA